MNVGPAQEKKGTATPEMNVTPLVDVVLVLLIIFMVIMPLMPAHFWVHVPDKPDSDEITPPDPNEKQPLVVSVNPEGEFQINKEIVPDEEFAEKLRRVLIARGERKVFFDAADNAPYSRAVRALDLARVGGAAHIAVLTEGVHD
ncbi:MAG: biopolymer transporter ExbD [Deltaproteobacteria bacterium]|nr:biopolymer transporter ExbD [Deltaproteobacteria bacterium]